MKKAIVPPLNFERVFEQQRMILKLEEKQKVEKQMRDALVKQ